MKRHRPTPIGGRRRETVAAPVIHVGYAIPRRGVPSASSFRRWIGAAIVAGGLAGFAELAIHIVGARRGRDLNRRYRQVEHATNVLAFPADPMARDRAGLLGDIVICAPVVLREALAQRKAPRHHFAHLAVHGTLHLLGHRHDVAAQARRMETLERVILASLGMPDPYAPPGPTPAPPRR